MAKQTSNQSYKEWEKRHPVKLFTAQDLLHDHPTKEKAQQVIDYFEMSDSEPVLLANNSSWGINLKKKEGN